MKTIGEKIRMYRTLQSWTQDQMADKIGLSLPAYSKIERGITDVTYSRLKQFSKIFGIAIAELVTLGKGDILKTQNDYEKIITEKDREINKLQARLIQLLDKKK